MSQEAGSTTNADLFPLRRLVFSSLLVGMTPLVPIPLLDDWAGDVLRRRLAADLAQHYEAKELGAAELELLALGRRDVTAGGCLKGCASSALGLAFKLVLKIFRKLARKILFFLTVKDCVDTFSRTFHEGYLLRHALARGVLAGEERAAVVRQALETTLEEIDVRPFEGHVGKVLRGGFRLLRHGARQLWELLTVWRRSPEDDAILRPGEAREELDQEAELGGLVDELTAGVERESGHLRRLEALFESRLEALTTPSTTPPTTLGA